MKGNIDKMRSLLILGAGGMGRMMQETALQLGYEDIAFLDDAKKEKDVIGKCCDYEAFYKITMQRLRHLGIIICVFFGRSG